MKSIDFKSLLIGILGTALVMVLMGQATHKKRYDVECITMSGKAGLIKCERNMGKWIAWAFLMI